MSKKVYIPIYTKDSSFIPQYANEDDAGCDVKAFMNYSLDPHSVTEINCGIKVNVPRGYVIDVRTRSGMAKNGVFVINSPGTIDPYYVGQIKVLLYNTNDYPYFVQENERIGQLVCHKFQKIEWQPVCEEVLEEAAKGKRGDNGFGSTGR